MIQFVKSYQTTDGQTWAAVDLAQTQELVLLLKKLPMPPDLLVGSARILVEEKDKVVDILTFTAKSRPRARKINGGTKKGKNKTNIDIEYPTSTAQRPVAKRAEKESQIGVG